MEALNLDSLTFTALLYMALFIILEQLVVFFLFILKKKSDYKKLKEKMNSFKAESSFFKKTYARGSYPELLSTTELNLLSPDFISLHQNLLVNLYVKHFFRNSKVFLIYELAQVIRDLKNSEKIKNYETRKITQEILRLAMTKNFDVFMSFIIKAAELEYEKQKALVNVAPDDLIYKEIEDIVEFEAFAISAFNKTEEDISLLFSLKEEYEGEDADEIKEIIENFIKEIKKA